MTLIDFIKYRKKCPICKNKLVVKAIFNGWEQGVFFIGSIELLLKNKAFIKSNFISEKDLYGDTAIEIKERFFKKINKIDLNNFYINFNDFESVCFKVRCELNNEMHYGYSSKVCVENNDLCNLTIGEEFVTVGDYILMNSYNIFDEKNLSFDDKTFVFDKNGKTTNIPFLPTEKWELKNMKKIINKVEKIMVLL